MDSSTCFPESARHFVLSLLPGPTQGPFKLTQKKLSVMSGNWDQAIWSSFTSIFILQVLSFDLTRAGPRLKKTFILCARDLEILCCSYFQVIFKKKPELLLDHSNRYVCRTTTSVGDSELQPQSAEIALLMAPTSLQTSDLPGSAFALSPELLHLQRDIAHTADEALLPQK